MSNSVPKMSELAHTSKVIDQVRIILNTSGLNRYSKPTFQALKQKLSQLEDSFTAGVLALSLEPAPHLTSKPVVQSATLVKTIPGKPEVVIDAPTKAVAIAAPAEVVPEKKSGKVNRSQ